MDINIRKTDLQDVEGIRQLYLDITKVKDGIIRLPYEITNEYITEVVHKSTDNGLGLVAIYEGEVIGEMHAFTPPIHVFRHILSDLTIMVHSAHHGQGIGRRLFVEYLSIVKSELPHIKRVELHVRSQIGGNIQFYKSLGFEEEGRHEGQILTADGELQTPISMALSL